MSHPNPRARLDYLDAVRAFALLLGIVFHAGLSFLPVFIGWAVMDVSTSAWVSAFTLISHAFRMELFFLMAGFFSCMTLARKGLRHLIRQRVVRVGVPFVLGWFLLRPLLVGAWIMGSESLRGDVDIVAGVLAGFRSLAQLPHSLFVGTHLWFLYYLLLITGLVLAVRVLVTRVPMLGAVSVHGLDRLTEWLARSPWGLSALALPTIACLWFMDGWGMGTPDKSLWPDLPILGVYTLCFVLGWFLFRQVRLMLAFSRLTTGRILAVLVAVVACLVLARFQMDVGHPHRAILRGAFLLAYAHVMWGLVALTIGGFRCVFDRPRPVVRYLADASYWLYLVHLPVVLWLQIAVAELPLHWGVKWFGISLLTVALGILMYEAFVRSTVIGWLLNGRRRPRGLVRSPVAPSSIKRPDPGPLV